MPRHGMGARGPRETACAHRLALDSPVYGTVGTLGNLSTLHIRVEPCSIFNSFVNILK